MSGASADTLDPAEVVARLFMPQRPALAAALECVYAMPEALAQQASLRGLSWDERGGWLLWTDDRDQPQRFRTDRGHFDAEQAWEAVVSHGLVNDSWLADSSRAFVTSALHRAQLDRGMSPKRLSHPHTLKACVIAAADARALETVEALVQAARVALHPWGLAATTQGVLWQFDEISAFQRSWVDPNVVDPERVPVFDSSRDTWRLAVAVRNNAAIVRASSALGPVADALTAPQRAPTFQAPLFLTNLSRVAFALATDAQRWDAAAREGAAVRLDATDPEFPQELAGVRFANLTNPFAPLATIFALGYGVRSIRGEAQLIAVEP